MTSYCPVCDKEALISANSPDCDYIIIEEFQELVLPQVIIPSWQRQKEEWTPRKILTNELAKVGMVMQQFYISCVFPHLPPSDGMPNQQCYDLGLEIAISAISGKRGVIVLGGNLCKYFTGYELKQVQGLSDVPSQYIPDGNVPRVFLPTIRSIYVNGAGEFGLGMKRFAKQIGVQCE